MGWGYIVRDVNYPEQYLLNRNSKPSFVSLPAAFLCGGREGGLVLGTQPSPPQQPSRRPFCSVSSPLPCHRFWNRPFGCTSFHCLLFLLPPSLEQSQKCSKASLSTPCWAAGNHCPHRGWADSPVSVSPSFPSLPVPFPNKDEKKLL